MRKSNKKGFTIVELVIVIAVVAILAAVLIPTFVNVVNKANVSNDTALVRNINTVLATEEVGGKPATMHEALKMAERGGFDVSKLTPRSSGEIVWDSETNRFALIDGDKTVYSEGNKNISQNASVWKIVKTAEEVEDNTVYSSYLAGSAIIGTVEVSTGFDAGNNTGITAVNYSNSDASKNVVISTNSFNTVVTVDAENDEVAHYGEAKEVNIIRVKMGTYTEYGNVLGNVNIAKGKIELANRAKVSNIIVKSLTDGNNNVVAAASNDEVVVEVNSEAEVTTVSSELSTIKVSEITIGNGAEKVGKIESDDSNAAYINNVGYSSLVEAVNALKDNETLVLRDNVELSEQLHIQNKNNIVLDLNNHTITSNESRAKAKAVLIENSSITIKGNGTINGEKIFEKSAVFHVVSSELNFINGTINGTGFKVYGILAGQDSIVNLGISGSGDGPIINSYNSCLCVNGQPQNAEATYNIYGGNYTSTRDTGDHDSNVIQISNADGNTKKYTVNIYGGTFRQTANPADGMSNILELRHTGAKAINIYGGEFYCNGEIENHYANDTTVVNDVCGFWRKSN